MLLLVHPKFSASNSMTRFVHDKFAKDFLEELLKSYGEVKSSEKVSGEIKEIDVLFTPNIQNVSNLQVLGLLGRFAESPAIFEPFRNAAKQDEICDCIQKLLEVRAGLRRKAKAQNSQIKESDIPKLWILTPTASASLLSSFNFNQKEGWMSGVYFLGDALRTAIVVIHHLPQIPETLWLRILGRGSTQEQAIVELQRLSLNHPFQKVKLELVYNLRENLKVNQDLDSEDRELIMRLEPIYQQNQEQAKLEGRRQVIENLLIVRFGSLSNELQAIISPILALSPEEFTPLLMQLSSEELIARFSRVS